MYQVQEGQRKVIAYASRSLTRSENNYSAFKLEFLALKWAVTEQFSNYLLGFKFKVYTDNYPLTHVLTLAKLDATGQRWVAAFSDYDFDLFYQPGVKNTAADMLSRPPVSKHKDQEVIESKTIQAICNTIHLAPFLDVLPNQNVNVLDATDSSGETMAQIEIGEIRRKQR